MDSYTSLAAPRRRFAVGLRGLTVPLGRIGGVPLSLSPMALPLAALATYFYGYLILNGWLGIPPVVGYVIGAVFTLCMGVSILLHEIGHALTSTRLGIGVRGITVDAMGGYTELETEVSRPGAELLVSLAGPVASLAVGLGCALGALILPIGTIAEQMATHLAWANIVLAAFNALPGLPLDGGRVLQAAVWAIAGDRSRGQRVAAWCGRIIAASTVFVALVALLAGALSMVGAVFGVLVAASIWTGASQAMGSAELADLLEGIDARRLLRPMVAVAEGTSLERAAWIVRSSGVGNPVVVVADGEGRIRGVVNGLAVSAVPRERRPWIAVESLIRQVRPEQVVTAECQGIDLVNAISDDPHADYLVVEGEDVIGVLRGADVTTLLESKGLVSRRTTQ